MTDPIQTAGDLMKAPILTVRPTMGMQELVDFLRENSIHAALVEEGDRLVGVVSWTDVLFHLSEESDEGSPFWRYYTAGDNPEFVESVPEGMNDVTVTDLMTPRVVTCDVGDSAGKLAELLVKEGIHRAVVTRGDQAAGIVTATDLLPVVSRYEKALQKVGTA